MKWDAKQYTELFGFVSDYGRELLDLIDVEEGMTCLDLGCGSGELTKQLSDLGLNVIGIDTSKAMIKAAKKAYPDIDFRVGDARDIEIEDQVDIVFSNAVFHWISQNDQLQMLDGISDVLKVGGQLVMEFGGYGNNERIHHALRRAFAKRGYYYENPFFLPTIGEYATLLEKVGFRVCEAKLYDRPTPLNGETGLEDWIRMFEKENFEGIEKDEAGDIIAEAAESVRRYLYNEGKWYADYVRIRIKAVKR